MSDPEARISKAGVIMAAMIACATENPFTAQPPQRLVDDPERGAAKLRGELAHQFGGERGDGRGGSAGRHDPPPRGILGARVHAAAGIHRHHHAVARRDRIQRRALHHDLAGDAGEDQHRPHGRGEAGDETRVGKRRGLKAHARCRMAQRGQHLLQERPARRHRRQEMRQPVQRRQLRQRPCAAREPRQRQRPAVLDDLLLQVEEQDGRILTGRDQHHYAPSVWVKLARPAVRRRR